MGNVTLEDLSQQEQELISSSRKALEDAYSPYSEFRVGSAVRTEDGEIYTGCNVENASYGLTVCAERIAMFKAVSEGETRFTDISIMLEVDQGVGAPCGACRQVMNEFNAGMNVLMCTTAGDIKKARLDELLPQSFGANYLETNEVAPEPAREYIDKKESSA